MSRLNSLVFALLLTANPAPAQNPDAAGILRKPIPDRLVVLTFDDASASHATTVAPILKELNFGGSFYVCDFDSFPTRKDWYMTWRQMRGLVADGFEVGNHTKGHVGGADPRPFQNMDDDLLAHRIPCCKTLAWPVYHSNTKASAELAAAGYVFGRGGHFRPYRPTIDHPFDIPSMYANDIETFVDSVRQATEGKIVVMTFHGVPDGEHPSVGIEPETFKEMMAYLKQNNYRVISLRDLDQYIDPARALKLPPTGAVRQNGPGRLLADDKPFFGKNIRSFGFPGLPPANIFQRNITVTVPATTDVTALAPVCKLSAEANLLPAAGVPRDFTKPQTYTVTARDGSQKTHTVTVKKTPIAKGTEVLNFELPVRSVVTPFGDHIDVIVAKDTDVTALAAKLTVSPFAKAEPASGTVRDFSKPQPYRIAAQDGTVRTVTVRTSRSEFSPAFTWSGAGQGRWGDATRWTDDLAQGQTPAKTGFADMTLSFQEKTTFHSTNDLGDALFINQLRLAGASGKIDGKSLLFVMNQATRSLPRIRQAANQSVTLALPLKLDADLTVDVDRNGTLSMEKLIEGPGSLIKTGDGRLLLSNARNTHTGGTVIRRGSLLVMASNGALGAGPVTVHEAGSLDLEHVDGTNPLILHGGVINANNGFGNNWNAPIVLYGNTQISAYSHLNLNQLSGGISGPGGFTQIGSVGPFGPVNGGTIVLAGDNTYAGPTVVRLGTLRVLRPLSLYHANADAWTPGNITVAPSATLQLTGNDKNAFTGEQLGRLLRQLTGKTDDNGLMAGSTLGIETTGEVTTIATDLTDSRGSGGGWYVLKKSGPGKLRLTGNNSRNGPTRVDAGVIEVMSLNRVAGGKPVSSLGAPTTPEHGTIAFAGDCGLTHLGSGEVTDRILDLTAFEPQTLTLDRSGDGLLKFTSDLEFSGFGHSKTLILTGAGPGEFAGNIANPYDRQGKATTSIVKAGAGQWTLSGVNTHSGETKVSAGTLTLAGPKALGRDAQVSVADGAMLELNFEGEITVRSLTLGGKLQPAGVYGAGKWLSGAGKIRVR